MFQNIKSGKFASIDIIDFEKIDNIHQIKVILQMIFLKKIINYFGTKVDVVISDMAVNTTGNKNLTQSIQVNCMDAMKFSKETLRNDGKFISKIFMGSTFNEIISEAKKIFKESKVLNHWLVEKFKESF